MQNNILDIKDLAVMVDGSHILNGVDLELEKGKVSVLMGPNGSGKSTLAKAVMGYPGVEVTEGDILFEGKSILDLTPDERAQRGIFLSFQYPSEISGVTISSFLRMIYNKKHAQALTPMKFRSFIKEKLEILKMDESFLQRYLNEGFSGGEKKRMEILQLLTLEPKLAILDETDSGLDVDAIRIVSDAVNMIKEKTGMTVLLITHYTRILKYIQPDRVFVMQEGKITQSGEKELADVLEERGFASSDE